MGPFIGAWRSGATEIRREVEGRERLGRTMRGRRPSSSASGSMVSSRKDGGRMSGQKQLVMGFLVILRVFPPFVTYTQFTAPSSSAHRDILLHRVILGYPSPDQDDFLKQKSDHVPLLL